MAFVYWIHLPEHTDVTKDGYVGFTSKTVESRFKQHRDDSIREKYKNLPIYNAMNKYGNLLVVETLVEGSNEYCLMIENKLRPEVKIGWNIKIGGDFGSLGVKASEETKLKMSETRRGESNGFYGKEHSEETKQKLREINLGKKASEETKNKLSAMRKGKKRNLSPEQRKKMSDRSKAQVMSESAKLKMSISKTGIYVAWRSCAATDIWLCAKDVYEYLEENPSNGRHKTAHHFKVTPNQIKTIHKKIRSGWNPNEDQEYLSWLEEKKG